MLRALEASKAKLSSYYGKTNKTHDDLFAIDTGLAPQHKLHFFTGKG